MTRDHAHDHEDLRRHLAGVLAHAHTRPPQPPDTALTRPGGFHSNGTATPVPPTLVNSGNATPWTGGTNTPFLPSGKVSGSSSPLPGTSGTVTPTKTGRLSTTLEKPELEPQWKIVTWNVRSDADLECEPRDPLDDPDNPKSWPLWRRSMIIGIVVGCSVCGTTCSSMASSGYEYIQRDLNVSHEVALLAVSLFVLALGVGPAVIGPVSEFHGRRMIYIVFFGFFVLFNFPVAFANNPAVFFIFRFLTGVCTSAFLSVAGGSVHDMFAPEDSFEPMAIFSAGPFLGPVLGPLIFGFVDYFTDDFRWSFYVIIIWAAVLWLANLFLCPETLASVILTRRAQKLREETRDPRWVSQAELDRGDRTQIQTLRAFLRRVPQLLREPMMICLCIWSSFLLGVTYLMMQAVPYVLKLHGFVLWQCGLSFLGLTVGMLLCIASIPFWRRLHDRAVAKNGGTSTPEMRLPMAMCGSVLTALSLYLFGLTSFRHGVHWSGPIIALMPFGYGILLVFIAVFTFTAEVWRSKAASALATNALCRCSSAAAFPLFSVQMYNGLGAVGASLLLAGVNTLMIPIPFIFYKYGPAIRAKSKHAD